MPNIYVRNPLSLFDIFFRKTAYEETILLVIEAKIACFSCFAFQASVCSKMCQKCTAVMTCLLTLKH